MELADISEDDSHSELTGIWMTLHVRPFTTSLPSAAELPEEGMYSLAVQRGDLDPLL